MKTLFTLLATLIFATAIHAQCAKYAGSPQSLNLVVCEGGTFQVSTLGDEVFTDPSDTLVFVVYPVFIDNPVAVNSTTGPPAFGVFNGQSFGVAGQTYQIAAVAGLSGAGPYGINPNDPCLSISPVGTVTFVAGAASAVIGAVQPITCAMPSVTLDGSGSSSGPEYTYEWSTTNGSISGLSNTPTTSVNAPGLYCLTVTNQTTGCGDTQCVTVVESSNVPLASIAPATLPCNGGNVTLSVSPQLSWYTFQWTGPGIVSGVNTVNPVVNQPGTYCVVVTDINNGCTKQVCRDILPKVQLSVTGPEVVCGPGTYTFLLNTFSSQGLPYQLQYQINGTPQAPLVITSNPYAFVAQISGPTTFQFTASDQSGCQSDPVVQTANFDDFDIGFTVTQNGCQPAQVTATVSGPYQNTANSFLWDNGSQAPAIQVTQPGWHSVTVQDNYGCQRTDSVFVTPDFGGTCAVVEGFVLKDELDNCSPDPGEQQLSGWLVEAQGSTTSFFGTTDADGYYFIPVDPGDYTLSVFPPSQFWESCSNDVPVSLPNPDDVATVDFLIQPVPGCPALTVDISTPLLRRCFSTNKYFVNYCNDGTGIATDAYVVVSFDPFLTLNNASLPYTDLGGNAYQFDLGDVEPGDCGSFWAQVTLSCSATFGQTHCTEAHIYPDTACVQTDPLWSGASIEIEADCSDSTRFILKNVGSGTMTVPLEYIVIEDAVMYRYDTGAPLAPGESMEVVLPPNGSTWRIEAEQEPLHPQPSQPVAFVEGCGVNPGGSFSLGFVNQFASGDPEQYTDIDCTVNIGAFDPNDKSAAPTGYRDEHFIAQNTEIEYLIRFQNTGTDTAFTVVIRDTLSQHLDVTTLRPGASSHAYEMEIYGQGIVKFIFPDIMLPDSNVNVEASQGFVQFKISPKDSLPVFTEIENSAAIFFDFNEPVITNTTLHTIEKPVVNTAADVMLCAGEAFGGVVFTADTLVVDTFSFAQYDSMVWTDIRVLPVFETDLEATICQGTSYLFNGQNLTQTGTYQAMLTASNGCDSTVTLTLAVVENFEGEINTQICEGEIYEFDNQQLTEPGEYVAVYQTAAGCDSTVTLTLVVLPIFETTIVAAICEGQTYHFNGEELSQPGQYEAVFAGVNSCDSTVTLLLDVLIAPQISASATICEGETIIFDGEEISEPGQYEATFTSSMGCDSTVTLQLAVLPSPNDTIIIEAEYGLPFFSDTILYEYLTAANGCDSVVTLIVSVHTDVKNTLENDLNLSIFPNPASGSFFVKFDLKQPENVSLRVLDLIGREVKFETEKTRFYSGEHILQIGVNDWPDGVYLIHFQTDSSVKAGKVVLNR
jgi:uncharacterized repeat protein (TIGR01451 family)